MSDTPVNISKRHFIAGAVCPACSMSWTPSKCGMKTIVPHRECVSCGAPIRSMSRANRCLKNGTLGSIILRRNRADPKGAVGAVFPTQN